MNKHEFLDAATIVLMYSLAIIALICFACAVAYRAHKAREFERSRARNANRHWQPFNFAKHPQAPQQYGIYKVRYEEEFGEGVLQTFGYSFATYDTIQGRWFVVGADMLITADPLKHGRLMWAYRT